MTYNSKTPVLIIIFNRPIFVKNLINILDKSSLRRFMWWQMALEIL